MEIGTGLSILGGAVGGKEVIQRVLGPTADYLGDGLKGWTENRVKNAGKIFTKAHEKLGGKADGPGAVPPRVLKEILGEGSFCDDELTTEYFGGVLASSRSEIGRDDRALSYLKIIADLSTYQIRFHYICYHWWRKLFLDSGLRPTFGEDLQKTWLFLPRSFIRQAMDLSEKEHVSDISMHCIAGLDNQGLLEIAFWGTEDHVNDLCKKRGWNSVSDAGVTVCPTQYGIDLWLWATGNGSVDRMLFLSSSGMLNCPDLLTFDSEPIKLVKE